MTTPDPAGSRAAHRLLSLSRPAVNAPGGSEAPDPAAGGHHDEQEG